MSPTNCAATEIQTPPAAAERHDELLESILENPHLPTPPALALRIVESASKEDCNPKDILKLLSQDPGLCGKVLKTVNSSMFGLSKPVTTLERAIVVLGLKPLRSLVLGLSLPAIQSRTTDSAILKYWQESVAGAVIARELAVRLRQPDPEDCLIAGLLRDLGIVVLAQVFPDEYRVLSNTDRERLDLMPCEAEEAAFGVHHAEIGAVVLNSWNLPQEIVLPVRYHHHPEALTGVATVVQKRAWLLALAAQLARAEILANYPAALRQLFDMAQTQFGLSESALGDLVQDLTPRIEEFAAVLQIDMGSSANLGFVLAQASDALVKLSLERAAKPAAETVTNAKATTGGPFRLTKNTLPGNEALTDFDQDYFSQLLSAGRVGNYEVREVLGRGGMGIVFKGYDPGLARFVAIKMLLPQLVVTSDARKRFEREARSIAAIKHDNVVALYDISDFNGLPYFVMEYVDGTSLETRLLEKGPLPLADVIRFGRHIAAGLQAAHSQRVIHRDVKPANILIEERTRQAKLTDFGLARAMDQVSLTQPGLVAGTPLYMAPEQFAGGAIDERADLFSLGSLLYAMCSGKPPFAGDSYPQLMRQVCDAKPVPLRTLCPTIPAWLEQLIAKLHAKQPAARCPSAGTVVHVFDAALV